VSRRSGRDAHDWVVALGRGKAGAVFAGVGGERSGREEEIAQMIGSSRETVTRLLADFRRRQLVQVMGSTLVIKNKSALESIVTG
jgi:CRP-like cAMP-binding protein